jgi:predicted NUDIX family phosphoesterase
MEQVFVVRRADYFDGDWPQGFIHLDDREAANHLASLTAAGFFVDRPAAEEDPSLKQIIPYCVITRGTEIFLVRRRKKGTEARLHGQYSIGLGGHIGPEDRTDGGNLLENGLLRELAEELILPDFPASALRIAGLCNDDGNPVGQVHFGLVYRLDLSHQEDPLQDHPDVRIREIQKLSGGFGRLVEIRDLWEDPSCFEGWSRIVLVALFNLPRQGEDPTSTQSDQGQCQRGTAQ